VLVLDVLDNGIPTAVVVNEVAIAGGVNDVQSQADTVLFDDVRDSLDFRCAPDRLIGLHAAFAVDKVGREDGVDERGFAEPGLACVLSQYTLIWQAFAELLAYRHR